MALQSHPRHLREPGRPQDGFGKGARSFPTKGEATKIIVTQTTRVVRRIDLGKRCRNRNISYLLIIFRTDTVDFCQLTKHHQPTQKGANMRRKSVNFKKSAGSFKKKASKTHKKNTPSFRAQRGGIRL